MPVTPSTIASFAGFSDYAAFLGPFESGGDLFVVLGHRDTGSTFWIEVWMSSDDGATWAAQDNSNRVQCYEAATWDSIRVFCKTADLSTILIFYLDTSQHISFTGFGLISHVFLTGATLMLSGSPVTPVQVSGKNYPNFSGRRFSTGDYLMDWSDNDVLLSGNAATTLCLMNGSGVATGSFQEDASVVEHELVNSFGIAGGNSTFVMMFGRDTTNAVQREFYDAGGSTPGYYVLEAGAGGSFFGPMIGVEDQWGTMLMPMMTVPAWDTNGNLSAIECDMGSPPGGLTTTTFSGPGVTGSANLTSAVFWSANSTRYIFAVNFNLDFTTNIIYYQNSGSGWTGPTVLLASQNAIKNISARALSGCIGIVYDDSTIGVLSALDVTKFICWAPGSNAGCRYRGYLMM